MSMSPRTFALVSVVAFLGLVALGFFLFLLPADFEVEEKVVQTATRTELPIVSIRHNGELHHGRQESFCWHWVPKLVCQDVDTWEGFSHAPAIRVMQGDFLALVVDQDEGRLSATIFTVQDTSELNIDQEVGAFPDSFFVDLPPDVYYLTAFYRAEPGDVSYGFKLDVRLLEMK